MTFVTLEINLHQGKNQKLHQLCGPSAYLFKNREQYAQTENIQELYQFEFCK